jgi:phosphoenolpyruvate synthase/pyruvate phosphate dikinase
MILSLEECSDIATVGGKAAGLARLAALGLPVPPTLVLPVDAEPPDEADRDRLVLELGEPLAVRSSAVGEDAADRSAAGQFESVLGVRHGALADAITQVRESAHADRVRAYAGGAPPPMAVVIQREVPASRSGVAFSVDPITGERAVLIECVFGAGEALVSGAAVPDRYRVDDEDGGVTARLGSKDDPSRRTLRTLRDDEARTIASLVRTAERGFGVPVDTEFCFEGPQAWLVQCRAITTVESPR